MPAKTLYSHQSTFSRRWTSLLVVISLFASSLLSSIIVLNPQLFKLQNPLLTGDKVLVCTHEGLRWFSTNTLSNLKHNQFSAQDAAQHDDAHSRYNAHCPIFKLHDNNTHYVEGTYNLIGFIRFTGHIGNYQSLPVKDINRLYLIAPKHSPPMVIKFS